MATLFSDAFPEQTNAPGLVSYRASGGTVKVATFSYTVPAGGVNVTTASRLNLFLMPFNARIVRGVIEVTTAFGANTTCNLVAVDAATETTLWGSSGINLNTVALNEVDRVGRGMLYTSPTDIPSSIRANGGVRIALALTGTATSFAAGGQVRGFFLYV